jgi:hypothetical protein
MTEEKKVITIDDVEYTEDQLSDEAKMCINHINSLEQKIGSAQFNLVQLQMGRQKFMELLSEAINRSQENEEDEVAS